MNNLFFLICSILNLIITAHGLECQYEIVESMPDKLVFKQQLDFKPTLTHECLIDIVNNAKTTLRIASFYWTLTPEPEFASHPSTEAGKRIMSAVVDAAKRGVNLEVVLDNSSRKSMNNAEDVRNLEEVGTVKFVNMTKLLRSGVLHTKFMIADNKTFYLGSSNFDWRSYTQIKEIGIKVNDCETLAQDLDKIFQTYMLMADEKQVPENFPDNIKTTINMQSPLKITLGELKSEVFLGGSPPAFNGIKDQWTGRTDDIDGLLNTINKAHHRLDISVMNYSPTTEFIWPKRFWPRIDNALRRAAFERKIPVRLLFSDWAHNKPEEIMWYKSLNQVQCRALKGGGIHVKMFKVPAYDKFQKKLPYSRVKHDKYMVTDRGLFIGTSNWSADYFINTCGVSLVIQPANDNSIGIHGNETTSQYSIIRKMQDLFERDFTSEFAHELDTPNIS